MRLLIAVALTAIGFIGYQVWHKHQLESQKNQCLSQSAEEATTVLQYQVKAAVCSVRYQN